VLSGPLPQNRKLLQPQDPRLLLDQLFAFWFVSFIVAPLSDLRSEGGVPSGGVDLFDFLNPDILIWEGILQGRHEGFFIGPFVLLQTFD
jgi:hypothetical protein